MKYQNIQELFQAMDHLNIMIIGDVMIDSYLWGKVERISPEAPVPVVSAQKKENRLGGAANVALNIQSMGANPYLCSVIGYDEAGENFLHILSENNMPVKGIVRQIGRKTSVKTRIISGGQQLLRIDEESTSDISGPTEDAFLEHIISILDEQKIDGIIFQDYDKGSITPLIIKEVSKKASTKQIPTLVDPKKRHFNDYRGVTLFKPNFKELLEGTNTDIKKDNLNELTRVADQFRREHDISYLFITLSELGVFLNYEGGSLHLPAEIRDIADVSGAGDTVISMISLCWSAGLDLENSARLSNISGGLVCEKVGVVPITRQMLLSDGVDLNS